MDLNHDLLSQSQMCCHYTNPEYMVRLGGFEPPTPALMALIDGAAPSKITG